MSFRIGTVDFTSPLFMAPMEGITDAPFRKLVREFGCGVTCTQMIHAEGLLRGTQRRFLETTTMTPAEHPVGMQLCGSSPEIVAEASRKAVDLGADFIDLNMGCPAKGVVALGAGAALMKNPAQAAAIVREVKRAVNIPVTAKIRAGWDDRYQTAEEMASLLANEGLSCLAVHARTREQQHRGKADWNLIARLKSQLSIPVVGNGGVNSPEQVAQMQKETGCDGVMIARGALGNPWIFQERRPTVGEIRNTLLAHMDSHLTFYEHRATALITFRKHIVWYTTGLANAAEFRVRVFKKENSLGVVLEMIGSFFDRFDPDSSPSPEYAG